MTYKKASEKREKLHRDLKIIKVSDHRITADIMELDVFMSDCSNEEMMEHLAKDFNEIKKSEQPEK